MIEADAIALATQFLNERFGPNPMVLKSRVGFKFLRARYNSERGYPTFRHWIVKFELIDLDKHYADLGDAVTVVVHAKTRHVCLFGELP